MGRVTVPDGERLPQVGDALECITPHCYQTLTHYERLPLRARRHAGRHLAYRRALPVVGSGSTGPHLPESGISQRKGARTARHLLFAASIALPVALSVGAATAEDVYLRAGIGFDRPTKTEFRDNNCRDRGAGPALRLRSRLPTVRRIVRLGGFGNGARLRSRDRRHRRAGAENRGLWSSTAQASAFSGRANFLAPERRQSVSVDLSPFCPEWSPLTWTFRRWACRGLARSIPSSAPVSASPGSRRARRG